VDGRDDIFLSYPGGSAPDIENVLALGEGLRKFGLDPWIGSEDGPDEAEFSMQPILEVVRSAPVFLACLGVSLAGRWGRNEMAEAAHRAQVDADFLIGVVLMPGSSEDSIESLPPVFANAMRFDLRDGIDAARVAPILRRHLIAAGGAAEAVQRALLGDSRCVVITGRAGSGKSSLAQVARDRLRNPFGGQERLDGHIWIDAGRERDTKDILFELLHELGAVLVPDSDAVTAYRKQTAEARFLIVVDEAPGGDLTDLVPSAPSMVMILSQASPEIRVPHTRIDLDKPLPKPAPRRPAVQAGYASDSPVGVDLLEIEQPVEALCSVIAAKDVEPPLSIGLFGEWGSGKTFFVERMRDRIDSLAAASAASESSSYCSSIKQVVFNAWHYADANLWASLAGRVFEGLDESTPESQQLFEKLASSRLQLQDAEAEQEAAEKRVRRAEEEEQATRDELKQTTIRLGDVANAAVDVFAKTPEGAAVVEKLQASLGREGDDEAGAEETARNLLSTGGTALEVWRQSSRQSKGMLVLAVVAVVALCALAAFVPGTVTAAIAALSVLVAAIGLLGRPAAVVIGAHRLAVEREEQLRQQQRRNLESEIRQLDAAAAEARSRREEAQRLVEEAERTIADIKGGKGLFRFIADRANGDAYAPYLGLVALVRRDFEHLTELMEQADPARIDRIVLYIDDLDRCPSERVVEVLEAVHLRMASKLFVVVVAADPRWLVASLERRYAGEMTSLEGLSWNPTPLDYLEKIFQIPFALKGMDEAAFGRLVRHLMPVKAEGLPGAGRATLPAAPAEADPPPRAAPAAPQPAPAPQIELEPEGLQVTREEVELLAKLGLVVRTPRSAKRMTNLYRLIRASLTTTQLDALLGQPEGEPAFPCVQMLLAMTIAFPEASQHLIRAIEREPEIEDWWQWAARWEPPPRLADDWFRIRLGLNPLLGQVSPPLQLFAEWAPEVVRYSYGLQLADAAALPRPQ
jgi:hypothetical protein